MKQQLNYIIGVLNLLLVSFLTLSFTAGAQSGNQDRIGTLTFSAQAKSYEPDFQFTAFLLESENPINFKEFSVLAGDDTIRLSENVHAPDDVFQSNLVHFNGLQSNLRFIDVGNETANIILINGAGGVQHKAKPSKRDSICELADVIPQSEWRAGLAAPNYNRSFTEVENIIVHHSAGSNNATDFVQVVRDIYIYHTESNGWSDIGYNYLIDPEGSIYAGRDPADGEQDKVRGAHFCASNSGTMGICLMGNYQEIQPTDTTYGALKNLLSWKISKEDQLSATGIHPHPLNNNLPQIAGHRDGCSTLCPGQFVYDQLPTIREQVEAIVMSCGNTDSSDNPDEPDDPDNPDDNDSTDTDPIVIDIDLDEKEPQPNYTLYPNPLGKSYSLNVALDEEEQTAIDEVLVLSNSGNRVGFVSITQYKTYWKIYLPTTLEAGIYFITFIKGDEKVTKKFVIGF
jgi:hypothetical protein